MLFKYWIVETCNCIKQKNVFLAYVSRYFSCCNCLFSVSDVNLSSVHIFCVHPILRIFVNYEFCIRADKYCTKGTVHKSHPFFSKIFSPLLSNCTHFSYTLQHTCPTFVLPSTLRRGRYLWLALNLKIDCFCSQSLK